LFLLSTPPVSCIPQSRWFDQKFLHHKSCQLHCAESEIINYNSWHKEGHPEDPLRRAYPIFQYEPLPHLRTTRQARSTLLFYKVIWIPPYCGTLAVPTYLPFRYKSRQATPKRIIYIFLWRSLISMKYGRRPPVILLFPQHTDTGYSLDSPPVVFRHLWEAGRKG
jgi:hypothetical protein